jgi:hypothetical protein
LYKIKAQATSPIIKNGLNSWIRKAKYAAKKYQREQINKILKALKRMDDKADIKKAI